MWDVTQRDGQAVALPFTSTAVTKWLVLDCRRFLEHDTHSGAVVTTVTSQQAGSGVKSTAFRLSVWS